MRAYLHAAIAEQTATIAAKSAEIERLEMRRHVIADAKADGEIRRRLLRDSMDARHRARGSGELIGQQAAEIVRLRQDIARLEERQRGDSEIRRIAALNGIPRETIVSEFQRWLQTQDFADVCARAPGRRCS